MRLNLFNAKILFLCVVFLLLAMLYHKTHNAEESANYQNLNKPDSILVGSQIDTSVGSDVQDNELIPLGVDGVVNKSSHRSFEDEIDILFTDDFVVDNDTLEQFRIFHKKLDSFAETHKSAFSGFAPDFSPANAAEISRIEAFVSVVKSSGPIDGLRILAKESASTNYYFLETLVKIECALVEKDIQSLYNYGMELADRVDSLESDASEFAVFCFLVHLDTSELHGIQIRGASDNHNAFNSLAKSFLRVLLVLAREGII